MRELRTDILLRLADSVVTSCVNDCLVAFQKTSNSHRNVYKAFVRRALFTADALGCFGLACVCNAFLRGAQCPPPVEKSKRWVSASSASEIGKVAVSDGDMPDRSKCSESMARSYIHTSALVLSYFPPFFQPLGMLVANAI